MTGYEMVVILRVGINAKDYKEAIENSGKVGKEIEKIIGEDYPTHLITVGVEEQNLIGEA